MGDYEAITEQVSHILRSKGKSVVDESNMLQPNSLSQDRSTHNPTMPMSFYRQQRVMCLFEAVGQIYIDFYV